MNELNHVTEGTRVYKSIKLKNQNLDLMSHVTLCNVKNKFPMAQVLFVIFIYLFSLTQSPGANEDVLEVKTIVDN